LKLRLEIPISLASLYAVARTEICLGQNLLLRVLEYERRFFSLIGPNKHEIEEK
jgi:hypothetical protein